MDKIIIPITMSYDHEELKNNIYGLQILEKKEAKYIKDLLAKEKGYVAEIWIDDFLDYFQNDNSLNKICYEEEVFQKDGFEKYKIIKNLKKKKNKEHICR